MLVFDENMAVRYGVDEAVMLQNLVFWIRKNAANGVNFHDGHWWTFNSLEAFTRLFPFWSQKQVRRILTSLQRSGAIVKGDFNENRFDRTNWYRLGDGIEEDLIGKYRITRLGSSELPERTLQNCPNGRMYIGEDIKQDIKQDGESPRGRAGEAEPRASRPPEEGDGGLFGETPQSAAGDGGPGSSVTAQSKEKKSAAKPGRAPFVPPTVGEVREYVALRGAGIDPVAFFSFYENRDWRLSDGRRMKDWRLAVVTWERRDRNGRRY